MMQHDLYGNAVPEKVGVKDPDAVRQYPFSAETIRLLNSIALKTGRPKSEIVAVAIALYAALLSFVSPELIDAIMNGELQNIFNPSI